MTEKEAIDLFEKTYTLQEQYKLENDIQGISNTLNQWPINIYQVRYYIDKINREHHENMVLYNIMFPPRGDRISIDSASDDSLIQHLLWKQKYLQAKKAGKTFDELCKEIRQIF